ncbi:MAG: hypothetical protein HZC28_06660 [Spirochaetes bacterium]|nr:hypothetical protein [Spirochaetota bacterium]
MKKIVINLTLPASAALVMLLCAFASGYILGRMNISGQKLVVASKGKIAKQETPAWKPVTNTGDCWDERNAILADYTGFISTPPRLLSVTPAEIRFAIRSNEYALGYKLNEVPALYLAPVVSGRLRITAEGVTTSAGFGVMAEYSMFGCGVLVNGVLPFGDVDVVGYVFVRVRL